MHTHADRQRADMACMQQAGGHTGRKAESQASHTGGRLDKEVDRQTERTGNG